MCVSGISKPFTLIIPCDAFMYSVTKPRLIVGYLAKNHTECYWDVELEPWASVILGQWSLLLQAEALIISSYLVTIPDPACLLV